MRQHYQKLLAAIVAGCCLGCQPGTEAPASVAEEAPVAASEAGAQAPTELAFTERAVLFPPELYQLYEKLNMRSFNSSFGPRLRHHCESYLIEFFPRDDIVIDSPTQMTLTAGDDMWVIEILGPGRIRVDNYITGSGSYSSSKELNVAYDDAAGDVRSDETWIERRPDCTPLPPDENAELILLDSSATVAEDGWVCGDLRSNPSAAAVTAHWRMLNRLPQERDPARQAWGSRDMLRIDLKEPVSAQGRCEPGENLLRVVKWPVYDGPDGTEIGAIQYVATVTGGLVDMFGFVGLDDGTTTKVEFDRVGGEQLVLVMADRRRSWLNLSTQGQADAWLRLDGFDQDVFLTLHYTFQQRLAAASELKAVAGVSLPVRTQRYPDAEVIYTLTDSGTAILPIDVQEEWMEVRFVPPPEYPLIGCGDDEADYDWVRGWIRFRDGDDWFVTEEHHQGC